MRYYLGIFLVVLKDVFVYQCVTGSILIRKLVRLVWDILILALEYIVCVHFFSPNQGAI
jgi:hypothetical protein